MSELSIRVSHTMSTRPNLQMCMLYRTHVRSVHHLGYTGYVRRMYGPPTVWQGYPTGTPPDISNIHRSDTGHRWSTPASVPSVPMRINPCFWPKGIKLARMYRSTPQRAGPPRCTVRHVPGQSNELQLRNMPVSARKYQSSRNPTVYHRCTAGEHLSGQAAETGSSGQSTPK